MSTEKLYLQDFGNELVLLARRIESEDLSDPFHKGRLFALYEVLSLLKQQARAFDLADETIGLQGIKVDSFLR